MNDLYDVLDVCLEELENGADVESIISRFPDFAGELRPILNASIKARSMVVSAPSPEVIRRGRAKLLQRASELREAKAAPRRRMIPLFQRLAISFTLTALFLASGTGLVGASSSALPGENLYPVKITWESLRLFFTFDHESRELLEHTFEDERLQEIDELLVEGKHAPIQFAGVYMEVSNQAYVSGIRIMILNTTVLPTGKLLNGAAVIVTGRTNTEGFVEAESIELLPAGTVVPTGEPPEVETQHNQNGNDNEEDVNDNVNINDNGNDAINGNDNGNENVNGNENINSNDNVNNNGNENVNDSNDENVNDNSNENVNDNSNDNSSNDNVNDSNDENVNDGGNDNGGGDNGSDGGNDGGGDKNDNGVGGNDNENSGGG